METIRRLAAELRRDSPRLSCAEVEGADSHPLAKAGILKPVEILNRWRCYACDERCFEEVEKPSSYTDDSDNERWRVYCAGGGTVEVPSPYVAAIWDYNERRMAETLRDLLKCTEARHEAASGVWRLGQSGDKHIKPFNIAYMTRILSPAEQASAKSILSDLRSIVIAGYVDADADLGGFRSRVAAISDVLAIDEKHRLAVNTGTLLALKQVMAMSIQKYPATIESATSLLRAEMHDGFEMVRETVESAQAELDARIDESKPSDGARGREDIVALVREVNTAMFNGKSLPKAVNYVRNGAIADGDRFYKQVMWARTFADSFVSNKKRKKNATRMQMLDSFWNSIREESKPNYEKTAQRRKRRRNADACAPPGPVPILDKGL